MATQYLFSPHLPQGGQYMPYPHSNGYNYVPKNGGFAFRKRFERVDWRKIAAVDVEQISRTLDFAVLQENIMNVTFCSIESELDIRTVDPNFLKLFKLAQLTIEYLLYSQEYLAGLCTSMEERARKTEEEQDKVKQELETLRKELVEVKRESHKRKKLLIAQQQLMHAGAGSYNKCPYCPKAFLNTPFLQAHISRRHGSNAGSVLGSGDPSKASSPDQGVGDSIANNPQMDAELCLIKARLHATEAQLEEERRMLASLRNKEDKIGPMVADRLEAATEQQSELHRRQIEEIKDVFLKELKEVNEKYVASEQALRELEERYGAKRSYLGVMQDDVEEEKELLQKQRAEVAALREQLKYQLETVEEQVQEKMEVQKKHRQHRPRHAPSPREKKFQENEPQEVAENHVMAVNIRQEKTPVKTVLVPEHQQNAISMYPSDDDESTALKSGTSSLRTPRTPRSTLGFSGASSLGLRTSQFIEQLRQNPTMGIMRDELASLLDEKVEKCGIPHGTTGISDQMLQNKLGMQHTQRQSYLQRYPNFLDLRERFNKEATDLALKKLHSAVPAALQPGSDSYLSRSTGLQEIRPARVSGQLGGTHSKTSGNTPRSASAPSPRQHTPKNPTGMNQSRPQPQPQPRAASPHKTTLSTASTTDWTSTQWDSDESVEDVNISGVKPFSPAPNVRLIQSGPRPSPRHSKQPIVIQARSLRHNDEDDIDDILKSDGEDASKTWQVQSQPHHARLSKTAPQFQGQNVANLKRMVEGQLQGRKQEKPFGGVDTIPSKGSQKKDQAYLEDFTDGSDWDGAEEPARPPTRRGGGGGKDTDVSSNTYGTSQWGSSSKGANAMKPEVRRSTSRSSFVSVTDISSDEDMNIENI